MGSPKLDGIRNVVKSNTCLSRSGKVLPSFQVQDLFSHLEHFDGELIEGKETDADVYNRTQSFVMSASKKGDLSFHVFDYTSPDWLHKHFYERHEFISNVVSSLGNSLVRVVPHENLENYQELLAYEEKQLALGCEGIMLRNPLAHYKNGRATFCENIIYKVKRFEDAEGLILDILPRMHNTNIQERDELGYAKRAQTKDALVPIEQAGKFIVAYKALILDVAPGNFTHAELEEIWRGRNLYIGKQHLKFRFFAHGVKDLPRFPRAVGLRCAIDMS